MIIAVDIGNSNVHLGIMRPGCPEWSSTMRFSSDCNRTADDWHSLLSSHMRKDPGAAAIRVVCSSVVPSLTQSFWDFAARYLDAEMLLVSPKLKLGITVSTEVPAATGTDRIVNSAAAFASYGGPVVIVDLGTATKIDAVTEDARFLGGSIAPGLGLAMDALVQRAAQLYAVPLTVPDRAIGNNTVKAVQSGVVLGHIKMIEGLVSQTVEELGGARAVVLTGGHASAIADHISVNTEMRPNLTLDGLRLLAEMNT